MADDFRRRGFALSDKGWASIATGASFAPTSVDSSLAVIPLRDGKPLTVVSAIVNAAHEGHVPVLVVDSRSAGDIESILSEPFLLAGQQADGRAFFSIEDRIRLSDDSYACAGKSGTLEWSEESRREMDKPRLVLEAGGETVTVLDSVDGLACPGPSVSAFRYSYSRGEEGRFRVFEDGQAVTQYTTIGAMRADGFRPVPLPLVPEHHIRDNARLARAALVATVDAETASYRQASEL